MKYDIALYERPENEGLSKVDIQNLINIIKPCEQGYLPIEIDHPNGTSSAIGFVTMDIVEQLDDYPETKNVKTFVADILNDIAKENESHTYDFNSITIFLSR